MRTQERQSFYFRTPTSNHRVNIPQKFNRTQKNSSEIIKITITIKSETGKHSIDALHQCLLEHGFPLNSMVSLFYQKIENSNNCGLNEEERDSTYKAELHLKDVEEAQRFIQKNEIINQGGLCLKFALQKNCLIKNNMLQRMENNNRFNNKNFQGSDYKNSSKNESPSRNCQIEFSKKDQKNCSQ